MKQWHPNRLLLGILAIPISGVLGTAVLLLRGPLTFPLTSNSGWIEIVSTTNFLIYQYLLIVSYALSFVGFLALYEYLRKDVRGEKLSFVGLVLTLWGTALALPALGIISFVASGVSQLGSDYQARIGQIITEAITGPSLVLGIVAAIFYTTGPLLFGIAIWRHAKLSNVSAGLFIFHGVLLSFGFSIFPALILGWILLAVSGLLISLDAWKENKKQGGNTTN